MGGLVLAVGVALIVMSDAVPAPLARGDAAPYFELRLLDDSTLSSLAELDALLAELDPEEPFPERELGLPRGRQGSPRRVALPEHWLDSRDVGAVDAEAEDDTSGG